jgi:hypothetical protein
MIFMQTTLQMIIQRASCRKTLGDALMGRIWQVVSDENGRKNPISISVSIFFGGNGIGFGK